MIRKQSLVLCDDSLRPRNSLAGGEGTGMGWGGGWSQLVTDVRGDKLIPLGPAESTELREAGTVIRIVTRTLGCRVGGSSPGRSPPAAWGASCWSRATLPRFSVSH